MLAALALARANAYGQFSLPYDPDFPESAPEEPAKEDGTAAEPDTLPPEGVGGPFLLLDRPDPASPLGGSPAAAEPSGDLERFLREQRPFEVGQERWNRTRAAVDEGRVPEDEFPAAPPAYVDAGGEYVIAGATEPPKPPAPEVELPTYGTSLSITGRKTISFAFSEKRFLSEQTTTGRGASQNLIDIEQQLQLRMQGKVGPKITVNVDYDDTKVNKQDISVTYQGDPNEVVQNASFGDIDLSLPATEFVSYNKQLFGIRVDLKYKRVKAIFIGSRTKGQTKAKQFKGNTQLTTQDILDTSYIRRRYYDLTFGDIRRLPLQAGSERVFLSRQVGGQQNVNEVTRTADDLAVLSSTFTGSFVELARGVDYTVDYVKGILTFRNTLDANTVVAVDFIDTTARSITQQSSTNSAAAGGGTGLIKLVKTFGDVQISTESEAGYRRELKTFYSLGRSQVLRDDGRGSFFLRVLDQNRNIVGPTLNPPQTYPETVEVDFENGVLQLKQPFAVAGDTSTPDPEIYAPSPLSKRLIELQYRFRLKTFFLEPNLVLQSEVVLADGVRLTRNVDYFIDYESGFLTFFNEDRIKPDSTIDVTFEVAPFAGNATESLLGGRFAYELWKDKWSIGSTMLYQTGAKGPTVPSINELAKSLLVYEVDTQLTNIRLASWLSATFAAEMAQSRSNPNLSKRALIENMEGVKQEDSTGFSDGFWQPSANPTRAPAAATAFTITSFDEQILAINPAAPAKPGETQKVVKLDYDFTVAGSSDEVSMVYPFSATGLDFSQKTVVEIVLAQGAVSNNQIRFQLGGVNEDSDGDGLTDTEDVGKDGIANTNDEGERDGILQPNEDIGWNYDPAGAGTKPVGAGNGRLDSEDLNRNGRILPDAEDLSGDSFGYQSNNPQLFDATDRSTITALTFAGYHTLQIPLNISQADAPRWLAIKQIRISVRRGAGGDTAGSVKFARIAVIGNTWQRGQTGNPATGVTVPGASALTVTAVNNVDNLEYKGRAIQLAGGDASQVFNDLYGSLEELQKQSNSQNIQEQALKLAYTGLAAGTTVFTKRVFVRAIDVSQHRNLNFLVFTNAQQSLCPGDGSTLDTTGERIFFLRGGSDRDFFEVRVPIRDCGWHKVSIEQVDRNGDQLPDAWAVAGGPPGSVAFSTGNPSLQQVGTLVAGVYNVSPSTTANGAVYLNEIHVDGPIVRVGNAEKLQADFTVAGWGNFGGKYRFVDRSYQTPTTLVANQDNLSESAYLNLTRISWLPMSFNLNYSKVTTPNVNAVGDLSNTVTLLGLGTVRTWSGTASGAFQRAAFPRLTLAHERFRIEYDQGSGRLDDRRTYKAGGSYGVPYNKFFLPRSIDGDFLHSVYSVNFLTPQTRAIAGNFNTDELTTGFGARMNFEPWRGSSFNPNFQTQRVKEDRLDFSTGREVGKSYPKSLSQTVGFTSSWNILPWFKPAASYTVSTLENYVLNPSTFIVAGTTGTTVVFDIGDIKAINRSGNGNVSLTLSAAEIYKKTRLLRSFTMTNGYQLQDGDVWNNVERGLDTKTAFWVRSPLRPTSPFAQRINLTVRDTFNSTQRWSPLEAYGLTGRRAPYRTLSVTNNFVRSIQKSETTGTPSKTIATTLPDLIASMGNLEQILHAERWAKSVQMNLKYASRQTENVAVTLQSDNSFGTDLRAIIRNRFDSSLSFNLRSTENTDLRIDQVTQRSDHKDATIQTTFDIRRFRFTPKVDYQNDTTSLGTGQRTQDTTAITPSLLVRADLALPRGMKLPFGKRLLTFTNRVIWTSTLSLAIRQSPITIADNTKLFNLNTSADYEIAKNLRMTLNGAVSRLWHKFLKEEDFISYQFGTQMTFQF
ncbi:MAG: hypothetical protein HYZ75_16440 [Elusimicrobia bacterium]|nr:hypothetical protein [Elusimicrobiota bacterium]